MPEQWRGGEVVARLHFGGEACVFCTDGEPVQGLTGAFMLPQRKMGDIGISPEELLNSALKALRGKGVGRIVARRFEPGGPLQGNSSGNVCGMHCIEFPFV